MNAAAREVMNSFTEIIMAFGQSDEYSFVFKKSAKVFNRREDKILSCVLSLFTSAYVFKFGEFFKEPVKEGEEEKSEIPMARPLRIPSFDGRVVLYPSFEDLKAYMSWRQVDCHINNLYNTVFWKLVKEGNLSTTEAHARLKGTFSKDKHEILFKEFKCNYNNEPEICKRGNLLLRVSKEVLNPNQENLEVNEAKTGKKSKKDENDEVILVHDDLIDKEAFYEKYDLNNRLN